jgi:Domain of unknown function (DUF4351)
LKRIAAGPADKREGALAELLIVTGLRKLRDSVNLETKKMPILIDIMDNPVIGPLIRQGRAEGQMEILLAQIEQRFGPILPRIRKRLDSLKPVQVRAVSLRLLDAQRIDDLFPRSAVKPS